MLPYMATCTDSDKVKIFIDTKIKQQLDDTRILVLKNQVTFYRKSMHHAIYLKC